MKVHEIIGASRDHVMPGGAFLPLYQRGIEGDFFTGGRKSPLSSL